MLVAAVATAIALVAGSVIRVRSRVTVTKAKGRDPTPSRLAEQFQPGRPSHLRRSDGGAERLSGGRRHGRSDRRRAGRLRAQQGQGKGHGKHSTTSWFSLGPTNAVYPASLNRHGSEYVTSGRITALAIEPGCDKSHCTLWVGAAGGGVWRTDKALGNNRSGRTSRTASSPPARSAR